MFTAEIDVLPRSGVSSQQSCVLYSELPGVPAIAIRSQDISPGGGIQIPLLTGYQNQIIHMGWRSKDQWIALTFP